MNDKRNITTVAGLERHPVMQSGLLDVDDRLLFCPFCGHSAGFRERGRFGTPDFYIRAECSNTSCGISTPAHYRTKEAAMEAWNRRIS